MGPPISNNLLDLAPPDIAYEAVDAHVDDPEFADLVAARYLSFVREPSRAV